MQSILPVRPFDYSVSPEERAREFALTAFCTAYFFVLGGMVGSFLNVVAWRMPRGENILWPGSRCPKCGTPIRLTDNVPILSWLWLRGRCRACSQPISPRYVVVEAVMASLFLGLAWWELLSGGRNLPVRAINQRTGVMWILWETQWDLIGIYVYHCCLVSLVAAFVLIALDRQRVPRRLLGFALGVGLLVPLFWPPLRPAAVWFPWNGPSEMPGWLRVALDGAAGLAAGWAMGAVIGRVAAAHRYQPEAPARDAHRYQPEAPARDAAHRYQPEAPARDAAHRYQPEAPARDAAGLVESREGPSPPSVEAATNELPPPETSVVEQTKLPPPSLRAGGETAAPVDSLAADAASRRAAIAALTCAGAYLGWQSALAIGLFAATAIVATSPPGRVWPPLRRVPAALYAALGILVLLAGWRWLFEAIAPG